MLGFESPLEIRAVPCQGGNLAFEPEVAQTIYVDVRWHSRSGFDVLASERGSIYRTMFSSMIYVILCLTGSTHCTLWAHKLIGYIFPSEKRRGHVLRWSTALCLKQTMLLVFVSLFVGVRNSFFHWF